MTIVRLIQLVIIARKNDYNYSYNSINLLIYQIFICCNDKKNKL